MIDRRWTDFCSRSAPNSRLGPATFELNESANEFNTVFVWMAPINNSTSSGVIKSSASERNCCGRARSNCSTEVLEWTPNTSSAVMLLFNINPFAMHSIAFFDIAAWASVIRWTLVFVAFPNQKFKKPRKIKIENRISPTSLQTLRLRHRASMYSSNPNDCFVKANSGLARR